MGTFREVFAGTASSARPLTVLCRTTVESGLSCQHCLESTKGSWVADIQLETSAEKPKTGRKEIAGIENSKHEVKKLYSMAFE